MFSFKMPNFDKIVREGVEERLATGLFEKQRQEAARKEKERRESLAAYFPEPKQEAPAAQGFWRILFK